MSRKQFYLLARMPILICSREPLHEDEIGIGSKIRPCHDQLSGSDTALVFVISGPAKKCRDSAEPLTVTRRALASASRNLA